MTRFPRCEFYRYLLSIFAYVICSYATMMVDAAIGGYFLGEDAVSAVNLVAPVGELFYCLALLLGTGASIGVALAMGRGDTAYVRRSFTVAITSVAVCQASLAMALAFVLNPVVRFLTAGSSLSAMTLSYLSLMIPWFVMNGLLTVLRAFTTLSGKPVLVMFSAVVQFAVNIGCNVLFLGVLGMGIWALALSSIISALAMGGVLLTHYLRSDCPFHLITTSWMEYKTQLRANIRYGSGFFSSDVAYLGFEFAMNTLVLRFMGGEALYAWSVVMMVFLVACYVTMAGQETCIALGGRYSGSGQEAAACQIRHKVYICTSGFIMALLAAIFLFPKILMPLFGASDSGQYAFLLPVVAKAMPFVLIGNLLTLSFLPVLQQGRTLMYSMLTLLQNMHLPLLLLLFHYLLPGREWWCFMAMIPVQAALFYLARMSGVPRCQA